MELTNSRRCSHTSFQPVIQVLCMVTDHSYQRRTWWRPAVDTHVCLLPQMLWLFSPSVVPNSLRPYGLKHASIPCPSPSPRSCSTNSCLLSWWGHAIISISSSVVPFSSCLLPFPGSFSISQLFASGSQSIGVSASASVLPKSIQGWFPLGLTDLISLLSKGLSRAFSNTTVWKHQFFNIQPSL